MTAEIGLLVINALLGLLLAIHARTDIGRDRAIHKLRDRITRSEVKVAKLKERLRERSS